MQSFNRISPETYRSAISNKKNWNVVEVNVYLCVSCLRYRWLFRSEPEKSNCPSEKFT